MITGTTYMLWGAAYAGLFVVLRPEPSPDPAVIRFRAAAWLAAGYCMTRFLTHGLTLWAHP